MSQAPPKQEFKGTASASPSSPASHQMGTRDRLAKRAVISKLNQLTQGQICLQDASTTSTHGTGTNQSAVPTLKVQNPVMYRQAVLGGGLGLAESYLEGDWDSDDLTGLLQTFVRDIQVAHQNDRKFALLNTLPRKLGEFINRNTHDGSKRNIAAHYDLGNEFFELFLDDTMTYSSGLFAHPETTLKDASIAKLDRICKKLDLQPGHHVLETGTGWGSFAIHAASNYGCMVTTTTISQQQHDLAKQRIEDAGLSDRVTLLLKDYRTLDGQYDKLVSIEMIEAVGHKYLDTYLGACSKLLRDNGQMLLQIISMPDQRYASYLKTTDFIRKHVFPGSCCPSLNALSSSVTRATDFRCAQYEDFTPHYVTTLGHWNDRFHQQLDQVRALGYTERFIRMWKYYLAYCQAGFAERYIGVGQMLLNKPGCRLVTPIPEILDADSSSINSSMEHAQ